MGFDQELARHPVATGGSHHTLPVPSPQIFAPPCRRLARDGPLAVVRPERRVSKEMPSERRMRSRCGSASARRRAYLELPPRRLLARGRQHHTAHRLRHDRHGIGVDRALLPAVQCFGYRAYGETASELGARPYSISKADPRKTTLRRALGMSAASTLVTMPKRVVFRILAQPRSGLMGGGAQGLSRESERRDRRDDAMALVPSGPCRGHENGRGLSWWRLSWTCLSYPWRPCACSCSRSAACCGGRDRSGR
jgi:hypothetical protein